MKIHKTTRVYLTVEIEEPWGTKGNSQWAGQGRTKADELKRLLRASGLDGLEGIDWQVESGDYCSHCNSEWEEDEEGPLCCDAAQVEWKAVPQ